MSKRPGSGSVVTVALIFLATPLAAQTPPAQQPSQAINVERKATGAADRDIQVGVYVNVRPDCSSGPLPTIRLAEPPVRGKVNVKSAKVNARNYKHCLALEVPGYVAFYRSEANFAGTDSFLLEVKYPGGRTENQKITVTVGGTSPTVPGAPTITPPRAPQPKQQSI